MFRESQIQIEAYDFFEISHKFLGQKRLLKLGLNPIFDYT